jgi:hypothetical protein
VGEDALIAHEGAEALADLAVVGVEVPVHHLGDGLLLGLDMGLSCRSKVATMLAPTSASRAS